MPRPSDMSVPEAARRMGCTPPTVRKLIEAGSLTARTERRKTRTYQFVAVADIDAWIAANGTYSGRLPLSAEANEAITVLREEVRRLRALIEEAEAPHPRVQSLPAPQTGPQAGPPADTRAGPSAASELVAAQEALRLQRAATAKLHEADEARSKGTALVLEAMQAFELADGKRREAAVVLDQIIGQLTSAGDPSTLT